MRGGIYYSDKLRIKFKSHQHNRIRVKGDFMDEEHFN
ncbi:hypothetical protein DESME_15645 [Desulfitobacterium metallireducens DSM 15288]|uniref:Uncharacterized protein n=1 Tax=Desulfitobacterium metallireducens DSM 15288 TaxID=871968 RepID=W0ED92_9FIRM|nr:hypothetical protein DESME_15645 [Desulfitobacterium metallireducens DSM 15288]